MIPQRAAGQALYLGLVWNLALFLAGPVSAAPGVGPNVFVDLAKKMVPSVVNISSLTTLKGPQNYGGPDEMFRRFFEMFPQYRGMPGPRGMPGEEDEDGAPPQLMPPPGRGGKMPKSVSLGTGFIIDSSGLILTNNHVVAGADEIKISFTEAADEKPSDAEVVGRDPEIDVALIRVKSKREMVPVALGNSDGLDVGEYVMAVGNPFGQGHSVTHGIISAKGRLAPDFPLANYLQTDAPINPGNSGGPLINLKGEVIGINNAIDQRAQGIGFAIPINLVKKVLPQLRTKGKVARGFIGVGVGELSPDVAKTIGVAKNVKGPLVTNVYPDEPAEKAGIKPYDVIIEFNGNKISNGNELIAQVTAVDVGKTVPIKIHRAGKELSLNILVGQRPGSQERADNNESAKKSKKKTSVDPGMSLTDITPDMAEELGLKKKAKGLGVVVTNVTYGGPADKAGIIRGDVILEVNTQPVEDVDSFYRIVKEKKSYLLRVRRADPRGLEFFQVVVLDLK